MYISYLVDQSLKHGTIKVYLPAILNLQRASGRTDPFAGVAWPRLMGEIKRVEVEKGGDKRQCLPIAPLIVTKFKEAWSQCKDEYNKDGQHLAYTSSPFSELTVPSNEDYDLSAHLSVQDMTQSTRQFSM